MKVAHLTTADISLRLLLFAQLCAVRDAGGEAVGISAPGPFVAELERAGIRHIPLHSSTRASDPVADVRAARELYGILRRERFDVLHTHNPKPGVYGRVVGRLARVPVIVNTVHGLYATEDHPWARRTRVYGLEGFAARFSDAELVQNPEDLALLERLHLTKHALLLGNGVDLTRFDGARFSAEARRSARAALGACDDTIVVGTVGRLVAEKGYPELFEAMAALDPRRYLLVAAGSEDPDKQDALPPAILDAARSRGVVFTGHRDDIETLYSAMDVFVLASHREGFPRAAMEAAAMSLPVVTTDVRGCRQVVEDQRNGLVVGVRDAGALAQAISTLGDDPCLRDQMGAEARARALVEFDEEEVVARVLDTYREVATRKVVAPIMLTLGSARRRSADPVVGTSSNGTVGSPMTPDRRLGPRVARAARQIRGDGPLVVLDLVIALVTYTLLYALRFDFSVPERYLHTFERYLPAACAVHVLATAVWGGYGRTWRYASIDEARRLLCAGATAGAVLFLLFGWGSEHVPYSVLIAGPVVATCLFGLVRFQSRLFAFRRFGDRKSGVRVAVIGAGSTGSAALREVRESPQLGLVPVVAVDDNPSLRGRQIHGVPIAGGIDDLADIIRDCDVNQLLYAIPSAPPGVLERVALAAEEAGIPVRVLPPPSSWVHSMPQLRSLRDLRIEDLLGRHQVAIDLEPVRELLAGKRVLVTGGGGWIGSEIARQVAAFSPARLVLLDHDETHLHDSMQAIDASGELALCDIRDASAVDALFARVRPEIVFHAAAHKHVSILEEHACEAILTNIAGTANIVDACVRAASTHLVCISTDKAATPSGVMAASKWIAEQVVLRHAPLDAAYCSVRFGNVLGSRGSVIPTFQRQIRAGGPVTVTDAAMTRYFMSTDEAVRLVLSAAAVTRGRSVLALEMGKQVNIYELAERMIRLSGYQPGVDMDIEITGRLPGENLSEQMVGSAERREGDQDGPIVAIAPVPLPSGELEDWLERLESLALAGDHGAARAALLELTAGALVVEEPTAPAPERRPSVNTRS